MLFVNSSLQRSIITVHCAAMQRLSFFIGLVCWMPSVHCSKFVVCGAAMQSGTHSSDVTTLITNWPLHCDYAWQCRRLCSIGRDDGGALWCFAVTVLVLVSHRSMASHCLLINLLLCCTCGFFNLFEGRIFGACCGNMWVEWHCQSEFSSKLAWKCWLHAKRMTMICVNSIRCGAAWSIFQ